MTGIENLVLSIFQDFFFSSLVIGCLFVAGMTAGLPIPGTAVYRRKKQLDEQRHRLQLQRIQELEETVLNRRLAYHQLPPGD